MVQGTARPLGTGDEGLAGACARPVLRGAGRSGRWGRCWVPRPSRPRPAAHHTHRKPSVLPEAVSGRHASAQSRSAGAGAADQSAATSFLRDHPIMAQLGRKLFRPDGVSTDAQEAAGSGAGGADRRAGLVSEGMGEGGRREAGAAPDNLGVPERLHARVWNALLRTLLAARWVLAPRGARWLPGAPRPLPPSANPPACCLSRRHRPFGLPPLPFAQREAPTPNESLPCTRSFAHTIALNPFHGTQEASLRLFHR